MTSAHKQILVAADVLIKELHEKTTAEKESQRDHKDKENERKREAHKGQTVWA